MSRPDSPELVRTRRRAWVAVVTAIALVAPNAYAAPPRRPKAHHDAMYEAARARLAEGLKLYSKKRYEQALAAFVQAYALTKLPAILLNLGQTSLRLGRPLDAAHDFEQYLREGTDGTALQKSRAQEMLAAAREQLGRIQVNAPQGAEVSVDGAVVGRAPLEEPVLVLPGSHEVKMTTPDGERSTTTRVAAGEDVAVKLVPARPTAPPSAVLEPGEGEEEGAPRAEGGGAAATESPGLLSPPKTTAPVYVAGGIALVAFAAAAVTGGIRLNAERNRSTAEDAIARTGQDFATCAGTFDPSIAEPCGVLNDAVHTLDSTKSLYTGALVVGAGSAAIALGWYLLAPKAGAASPSTGRAPRLSPYAGPGEAGARVNWAF